MASYAEPESPSLGLIPCSTLMDSSLFAVSWCIRHSLRTSQYSLINWATVKIDEHPRSKPRKERGFDEAKNNPFGHEPFDQ